MQFKTNWEPDEAAEELSKLVEKYGHGNKYRNVGDKVKFESDNRHGYKGFAESKSGVFHDTNLEINVKQHLQKAQL